MAFQRNRFSIQIYRYQIDLDPTSSRFNEFRRMIGFTIGIHLFQLLYFFKFSADSMPGK